MSNGAIWGEWIACCPILVFTTVTLIDKRYLTMVDWLLMVTFLLCIVAAFLVIISAYESAIFWLIASLVLYIPQIFLPRYVKSCDVHVDIICDVDSSGMVNLSQRYSHRASLAKCLTVFFPLMAINYLVGLWGHISPAITTLVYRFLSFLMTVFFPFAAMNIHFQALRHVQKVYYDIHNAHEARKNFLKYIFHEVCTPLNSLTMGIEILERSGRLDAVDYDALGKIKAASDVICDSLNDVLSMQKIEEGNMQLTLRPFNINEAIDKVFSSSRTTAMCKNVTFTSQVCTTLPVSLVGDRFRVEHVLTALVNNAIEFAPFDGEVSVDVTAQTSVAYSSSDTISEVTVRIKNQGDDTSIRQQIKLFSGTDMYDVLGQGSSTVEISVCKQIIHSHGGFIEIFEEDNCCTVLFTIPFVVSTGISGEGNETAMAADSNISLSSADCAVYIAPNDDKEENESDAESVGPRDERAPLKKNRALVVEGNVCTFHAVTPSQLRTPVIVVTLIYINTFFRWLYEREGDEIDSP